MTDRPVLFSGPMARAMFDGRKTQTRRVFQLPTKGIYVRKDMGGWAPTTNGGGGAFTIGRDGARKPAPETVGIWHQTTGRCLNAPYQVGDRLYVREAWRVNGWATDVATIFYRAHECASYTEMSSQFPVEGKTFVAPTPGKWRPGLHMPRWASRMTLIVTNVRVQPLQDISGEDAEAEGIFRHIAAHSVDKIFRGERSATAIQRYRELWDSLNAKRGFGWEVNPWVVAVTFSVAKANIDAVAA